MEPKLAITLKNIKKTDKMDAFIRERLAELLRVDSRIDECTVNIEKTEKPRKSGNPFLVRIIVKILATSDIVVERDSSGISMRDPLYPILSHVFATAKRKIMERVRGNPRGGVRLQAEYGAVVSKLFPDKKYGFLMTDSGKSVFFDESSVVGDEFDLLKKGMGVWFIERQGEKGPWASLVRICTSVS